MAAHSVDRTAKRWSYMFSSGVDLWSKSRTWGTMAWWFYFSAVAVDFSRFFFGRCCWFVRQRGPDILETFLSVPMPNGCLKRAGDICYAVTAWNWIICYTLYAKMVVFVLPSFFFGRAKTAGKVAKGFRFAVAGWRWKCIPAWNGNIHEWREISCGGGRGGPLSVRHPFMEGMRKNWENIHCSEILVMKYFRLSFFWYKFHFIGIKVWAYIFSIFRIGIRRFKHILGKYFKYFG